jgi:hypothetical protein
MLIRVKYCLTGKCSQEGMEKGIEVFDCAGSNPGIVVMARRMRMRIPVSCAGQTPPLRQAPRVEILGVGVI